MQTIEQLQKGELIGSKKIHISCGLTEFPREIFDVYETLEVLDLSGNSLSELPDDFHCLKHLKIIFLSYNNFSIFPKVLAKCASLTMIGIRANQISVFPENSLPEKLQWLILTENQIETVPKSIGDCHYLQKVAFAGNAIKELPIEMSNCTRLELLRISANNLQSIPAWLLSLPKLSWLAFSGNPCSIKDQKKNEYKEFHWNSFELKEQLGEGASGIISKANLKSVSESEVAIKVFKGKLTSDGFSEDELHTSMMVGDHENIIPIIGKITEHPEGKEGLIMELISTDFQNLGNPPSFETCTRDIFPAHVFYSLNQVLTITQGVSSAISHLHMKGILHGDVYAHNTMIDSKGNALMGDFGAATMYQKEADTSYLLERLDVRAFGCLLEDLLERTINEGEETLEKLVEIKNSCLNEIVHERPSFYEIESKINFFLQTTTN